MPRTALKISPQPQLSAMQRAANSEKPYTPRHDDTTADIMVERLIAWGVDTIFGLIGDGVNSVVEALRKRQDQIRFVTVRHEQAAALMASGYAKYTGRIGACLATGAPGAVNLMNGLYDAAQDRVPVIAITGATYHDLVGTHFLQDFDAVRLMNDVAVYNVMVSGPQHASMVTDLACRAALAKKGVAHLTVTQDIQHKKLFEDKASPMRGSIVGSASWSQPINIPPDNEIIAAAKVLNAGKRIAILAGRGAAGAEKQLEALAELLGAPIAKSLPGRTVIDDDSPYSTGGIGQLGTAPAQQMMKECDTLLILGCTMPYFNFYPDLGKARCVQIDAAPENIGLRYPAEVGLIGDTKATLEKLLPHLKQNENRDFLSHIQKAMSKWNKTLSEIETEETPTIKPQMAAAEIGRQLNNDALIAIDTGAHTIFAARHMRVHAGQQIAISGNLATMAPALPFAIAGQMAFPARQSIAITGDGGLTMLMGELATAVRYDLPIKVFVFKNNALALEVPEQKQIGNPPFGYDLQTIDFVKIAEACGMQAMGCAQPGLLADAIRATLAAAGPALLEITINNEEPILQPEKVKSPSSLL